MVTSSTKRPDALTIHKCAKHPDKTQYHTAESAFEIIPRRVKDDPDLKLYVYACDHCGFFHLSKKFGDEAIGRRLVLKDDGTIYQTGPRRLDPPPRDPVVLAAAEAERAEAERKAATLARLDEQRKVFQDAQRAASLAKVKAACDGVGVMTTTELEERSGMSNAAAKRYMRQLSWRSETFVGRRSLWIAPRIASDAPAVLAKVEQLRADMLAASDKRVATFARNREAERAEAAAAQARHDELWAAEQAAQLAADNATDDARTNPPAGEGRTPDPGAGVLERRVDIDAVADMTVGDLVRVMAAAGLVLGLWVSTAADED